MKNEIAMLCAAGLHLVAIPPINGKPTKKPINQGWNQARSASNPDGYSANAYDFINCEGFNFGLAHLPSRTLALDLDALSECLTLFDDVGLPLQAWLNDLNRIEIQSGKPNRGKLLFRLPDAVESFPTIQLEGKGGMLFELRNASKTGTTVQDVIFGTHPDTGTTYKVIGDIANIPEIPDELLSVALHWDDWKPCFDSALGIEQISPKIAPKQPQQGVNLKGYRCPIQEFNQSCSVADVLIRNGYKQAGKDRFIRPGSASKAPGAAIMHNCADGIERFFSHGGDALNDGFAHDAFDCFRLLEYGGDWPKALNWDEDITRHNQRLYMQEQPKNRAEEPREEPLFPMVAANELTAKPIKIEWLLENILEQDSLNLLFGEPASGKSLFALDWAFCMAAGMPWNGYRTKQTDVVIIAGEGFAGLARRLKALEVKYQRTAPERLFISKRPADFLDAENIKWLADTVSTTCPNPGLVIIDTLHRNMNGDENSSQDIGLFINNVDLYLKPLGAAVLVVHHSGHGQKDRSRGSSSIRAAMDGEFSATKNDGGITLTCSQGQGF